MVLDDHKLVVKCVVTYTQCSVDDKLALTSLGVRIFISDSFSRRIPRMTGYNDYVVG